MACITLTKGYKLQCIGGAGGVKAVGLAIFENGAITSRPTGGVLTALPTSITKIYRYELKNSGNVFTETSALDINNRTVTYTGSMTAILNTLDDEMMNELFNMSLSETFLFVEMNNGTIILAGAEMGATTTYVTTSGGDIASGVNATVTFATIESFPFLTLDTTAMTAYRGLIQE